MRKKTGKGDVKMKVSAPLEIAAASGSRRMRLGWAVKSSDNVVSGPEQVAGASRGTDMKHNILPPLLRFNPAFNRIVMLLN